MHDVSNAVASKECSDFFLSQAGGSLGLLAAEAEALFVGYLSQVFQRAEEHILRQVSGTCSRVEQVDCFESLRVLRCSRDAFLDEFFKACCLDDDCTQRAELEGMEDLDLCILQESLVATALERWSGQYRQLIVELNAYFPISLRDCPWGPHRLCRGFRAALEPLPLASPLKLSLLKLFDVVVLDNLGDIYGGLRSRLTELLPESRHLGGESLLPQTVSAASNVAESETVEMEFASEPLSVSASPLNEVAAEWVRRVLQLGQGAWIEWHQGVDVPARYRVVGAAQPSGQLALVGRHGSHKVMLSVHQVASLLSAGDMRVVEDGLSFDRALRSVIGGLRRLTSP